MSNLCLQFTMFCGNITPMESKASTFGPIQSPEAETAQELTEYNILNSPEIRIKYLTLTDELIRRMSEQRTDVAIFLDKSARPVEWLVRELWDELAPTDPDTGKTVPKPEMKFLNIDREQWGPFVGRSEEK